MKLCECGCGEVAPLAKKSDKRRGWVKGESVRFVLGHARRIYPAGTRYVRRMYDGYRRYEHQHVVEQMLGRPLERYETVHHINGVKNDNRIENLEVLSRSEHGRLHRHEQVKGAS